MSIQTNPEDSLRNGYLDTNKIRKPVPIKYDTKTAYTKAHPILYVLLGISLLAKLIKNIFDD